MVIIMAVLHITAQNVMSSSFSLMVVTVVSVPAVEKDTQINGLTALANPCFQFLTDTLS